MIKILVVEDHPVALRMAKIILEGMKHKVTTAETGEEALNCAKEQKFDLILMDIGLPDISGIEVAKRILAEKQNRHSPIVALTAHEEEEIKQESLAAGMKEVYNKPFTRDMAEKMLKKYINESLIRF